MGFKAYVSFQGINEVIDVSNPNFYDAQIEGAMSFLEKHPLSRPHDDKRRPYPIPVRPYWLVVNGYVHLKTNEDRRVKY